MTMLLPLFILVGFIAGYFVNAIAYHLSPLEDKTALTFRQVLVHFRQKKYAWHDTVPLILCVAAAIACALAPFTPIVTGALFLYFCFVLTLSVIDFRTQLLPDKLTLPLLWLGLVFNGKRLVRTVLIFTESSDQLSRATDRVPGLPASPGYVQ
ncbi:type 4 prepilin-like proteins leader peptide processing enzyme [Escherichia coli]|nr:type 4 prepilin-like proteins leader peptide processing enzyme [Escherichia coli]